MSVFQTLIFVSLIFYQLSIQQEVEDSSQVLVQARKVEAMVMDSETGMRGFLLTGQESFLEPFRQSSPLLPQEISELKKMVSHNTGEVELVESIEIHFKEWLEYATQIIDGKREKLNGNIGSGNSAQIGKGFIDSIRADFDDLLAAEESVKRERTRLARTTTLTLLFVVTLLSLLFGMAIAWIGRKQLLALSASYTSTLQKQMKQNDLLLKEQKLKSSLASLNELMVSEKRMDRLCDSILAYLAEALKFNVASFYVLHDDQVLYRRGAFALSQEKALETTQAQFRLGEGLVGQAAKEKRILNLNEVPDHYLKISSSLGEMKPRHLLIVPIESEGHVNAVIEMGFFEFNGVEATEFLLEARDGIGESVKSALFRERLEELLKEVREQAKALQAQQEELRVSNEELEEQTRLQRESQVRLETQQAELEENNSQLESQSRMLEQQTENLRAKNFELQRIQVNLKDKTRELEESSRYKSEFLANMSHELRTPLNSALILAKLLSDNKEGNLTPKQVEFSQQILSSGNDLLNLINDILDLSKVESGKLEIVPDRFSVEDMAESLKRMFDPLAKEKNLKFEISVSEAVPKMITSDQLRIEQVLKNLLSNAFKFTSEGKVTLEVQMRTDGQVSFSVRDTGIGIGTGQQQVIFEAFRQADGTTSRKFGGTGLGLSISRQLAALLRGTLMVESKEGEGSVFTFSLPAEWAPSLDEPSVLQKSAASLPLESKTVSVSSAEISRDVLKDDRDKVKASDRSILVIEDDLKFAAILRDMVREQKFKSLVATTATEGLELAQSHSPDAILLDLGLPDHSGLIVLDQLKENSSTRHIPIHVVSARDQAEQVLQMGAVGYLTKPVKQSDLKEMLQGLQRRIEKNFRDVLIIEDDKVQRQAIQELIGEEGIRIHGVATGKEGLEKLKSSVFDCVIMDLNLPDISGFDLIDELAELDEISHPPIIVYTGQDLTKEEELKLKRHSQSVIIKGAKSPERLLNEVTLFLHQVESRLSPKRKKILEELRSREKAFEGKHILLVDDDVRNIFALTSALEQKGAHVSMARNGKEAVDQLQQGLKPDVVLMDIMMPVMNGYEATLQIRRLPHVKNTPIIALTAKAMPDDREKCLEAGANDYLTKPVDLGKLLSLMRVWLSQAGGGLSHDLDRPLA